MCLGNYGNRWPPWAGYYLYMEASPMLPGQNARLLSRSFRGTRGPQCLQFYYHMYGSGSGTLRVLASTNGEDVLLWQQSGEQSMAWLRAQVEYRSDARHQVRPDKPVFTFTFRKQKNNSLTFPPQIVFEAVRGPSVRSDVAIDDITLDSGPCPGEHFNDGSSGSEPSLEPDVSVPSAETEVRAAGGNSNEIE